MPGLDDRGSGTPLAMRASTRYGHLPSLVTKERLCQGDEFAGYRIERELGRGGMGVVYLAEQISLRRRVALKVVTPQFAADPDFQARFEREARHAASIDHRNVVPIFAADSHEGLPYLAMRYIEGVDLRNLLSERKRLDAGFAAHVVSEVGKALDAAHAKGLVHRDVKPANVLLAGDDDRPEVYLTDFGLTKDASSKSGGLTNTGQWVGTLNYVAPEQLQGQSIEARSDIYSLGCVLFEMLSGELPYEGADAKKMWGHAHEPPPALADTDRELGQRFDAVLARAMAKEPPERFLSAGDFGRASLAAARDEVVTAPERSVATGPAAAGLALGERPTRTASHRPSEPQRAPVSQGGNASSQAATTPLAPQRSGGRRRTWLTATLGLVLVALGAGAAVLVAGRTPDVPPPGPAPNSPDPPPARPEPAPPEPDPAPPEPVGTWRGSAVQRTPAGTLEAFDIVLTITGLDPEAAGRLEGQPRSGAGCGGTLRFVGRRRSAFRFVNTETKNVPGCVDETSVAVTLADDDELSYLETWQTDAGQGMVQGTLQRP